MMLFSNCIKFFLPVKRSIVHHNNRMFRKFRNQFLCKPFFKQHSVHGTVILPGSNNFFSPFCCHNIRSFVLLSRNTVIYFFSSGSICIFSVQKALNPRFIDIIDTFLRNIFYFFKIFLYFFFILFFVEQRFFFRVIPFLFKAFLTASTVQSNASAISFNIASGCSFINAFSLTGSIFLNVLFSGFFDKFPVSLYCLSHLFKG